MPDTSTQYIGVDIAKQNFVADLQGKTATFKQTPQGFQSFIKQLPDNACVVCEATGGYEKPLIAALALKHIHIAITNPRRVRHFARSEGLLAKNDDIDAQLLSRFAKAIPPRHYQAPPEHIIELRELLRSRDQLIECQKLETNYAEHPSSQTLLIKLAKQRIRLYQKQLDSIEAQIEQLSCLTPSLQRKIMRITQIKGLGKISAWCLLAEIPELGTLKKGQAACLLGVAPHCKDSGSFNAKRSICGGRPRPRSVLYMAAVASVRSNPILKTFYQRLRLKGKPPKLALVAVMRKLIELVNQILKKPDFLLAS